MSTFFSTTSYLRSHPGCWIASSDNSAATPPTHLLTLLDVAVGTTGSQCRICICRKKLVLACYFPSHFSKEILHCVSKGPLKNDYMGSSQKWKKEDQKPIWGVSSKTGETAEVPWQWPQCPRMTVPQESLHPWATVQLWTLTKSADLWGSDTRTLRSFRWHQEGPHHDRAWPFHQLGWMGGWSTLNVFRERKEM